MKNRNCKHAFTMAEILISLTIIGIVAAITIPSLVGRTSSKQFATTYKKAFSSVGQALKLGAADGRDASTKLLSDTDTQLIAGKILEENVGARKLNTSWPIKTPPASIWNVNTNNHSYVPNSNECNQISTANFTLSSGAEIYVLKDGLSHIIINSAPTTNRDHRRCYSAGKPVIVGSGENTTVDYAGNYCLAFIDVNGPKGPNQVITCDNQNDIMSAKFIMGVTSNNCVLTSDSITDIYPVIIFDDQIQPATPAAAAVLEDRYQ